MAISDFLQGFIYGLLSRLDILKKSVVSENSKVQSGWNINIFAKSRDKKIINITMGHESETQLQETQERLSNQSTY